MRLAKLSILLLVFSFAAASDATARPRLFGWGRASRGACGAGNCGTSYSYSPAQKYSMPVQKGSPVQADEPVQKGTPAQKSDVSQKGPAQKSYAQVTAERKAGILARACRMFHPGGTFGGGRYEGVGCGSTPQQALANCCRFNSPVIARATARGSNGLFYAVTIYR